MALRRITPVCTCGRKLRALISGDHATFMAVRTCSKCRTRWHVLARPGVSLTKIQAVATTVEMVAL